MDRFTEAEIFVKTVEAGSITAAAAALSIDKSGVSRRLKSLENRLGTGLLNRSTRTLSLTDAGRSYYERSKGLLRSWQEMEDDASGADCALAGPIRIAAPLSFGLSQLGPVLIEFQHAHPDITLDVDFSDRKADLIAEGIDLAVRIGRLDDSALVARILAKVTMFAAASPDWLDRHGPVKTLDDLIDAPEMSYRLRSARSWPYRAPDGRNGTFTSATGMQASNGDFLRDAAISGLGFVIQPDFILCEAVRAGKLVPILKDYTFDAPSVYAVWSPTRHMPRRVRMLIDVLADRFGGVAPWSLDDKNTR